MNEWINKPWSIHTVEYYSAIKRNEVLRHTIAWVNPQNIMLCKKLHTKCHTLYDAIYIENPEQLNLYRLKAYGWFLGGGGDGEGPVTG